MASLDRADVIALLERLGSADDTEVLSAARMLHERVTAAGVTWDDLLVTEPTETEADRYADADDPDDEADDQPISPEQKAEDLAMIEKLLKYQVSAETRDELRAFKGDIEDGEFTAMDRKYCRDLLRRLETKGNR